MADAALQVLTQISVLLLLGILGTALARKLRISNVLILLIAGWVLGTITDFFVLDSTLLIGLATFTLAIVIFEGTSKLSFRQLDLYSGSALNITIWQLLFTVLFVGLVSYFWLFPNHPEGILFALILAVSVAGTDPSSVIIMLQDAQSKLARFLTLEAILNTPIVVLIPFIIIDSMVGGLSGLQLVNIAQQIVVGIGTGVILGILVFKALRKSYKDEVGSVLVISAALLSYIIAEQLNGSGVLSTATLGVLFGNLTIRRREELQKFSLSVSAVLEVIIFLLIGIIVGSSIPFTLQIAFSSLLIFFAMIAARLISAWVALRKEHTWQERIFAGVTAPKGIAVAVLIFTFALIPTIPQELLSTLFGVALYSVLMATVAAWIWNRHRKKLAEQTRLEQEHEAELARKRRKRAKLKRKQEKAGKAS